MTPQHNQTISREPNAKVPDLSLKLLSHDKLHSPRVSSHLNLLVSRSRKCPLGSLSPRDFPQKAKEAAYGGSRSRLRRKAIVDSLLIAQGLRGRFDKHIGFLYVSLP
jgi:hypothetical protein